MTKTLTEQWREGKLIFGKTYWCSDDEGNVAKLVLVNNNRFYEWTLGTEVTKDVKEVLAPVPSYEEYEDILQQNVNQESAIETYIEENKRLQEQIKEANEIIISFDKLVGKLIGTVFQNVLDYYKKYNVDRYKKSGV